MSLCPALVSLGRLQARRGDPEAGATLEEAWRVATATAELQRIAPTVTGIAEHAWLDGRLEEELERLESTYALAERVDKPWVRAELALWLRRAGRDVPPHPDDPEPCALAAAGDWRAAAAAWERIGYVYDAANALAEAGDVEALTVYDRLGATRVAAFMRREFRARGVRRIPRGPRRREPQPRRWPDAARVRSARPTAHGSDERRDRRSPRDLTQDGRPPRVVGPRQARRVVAQKPEEQSRFRFASRLRAGRPSRSARARPPRPGSTRRRRRRGRRRTRPRGLRGRRWRGRRSSGRSGP